MKYVAVEMTRSGTQGYRLVALETGVEGLFNMNSGHELVYLCTSSYISVVTMCRSTKRRKSSSRRKEAKESNHTAQTPSCHMPMHTMSASTFDYFNYAV
jgi:hypothetical protein